MQCFHWPHFITLWIEGKFTACAEYYLRLESRATGYGLYTDVKGCKLFPDSVPSLGPVLDGVSEGLRGRLRVPGDPRRLPAAAPKLMYLMRSSYTL